MDISKINVSLKQNVLYAEKMHMENVIAPLNVLTAVININPTIEDIST